MGTTGSAIDSREGGSIPPRPKKAAPVCAITRTDALQQFQRALGGATLYINTVAVALEAICSDTSAAQKAAANLNVGWRAPAGRSDVLAARIELPSTEPRMRELTAQTRAFVLRSVLVAACDALDTYVANVARLDWLKFDADTVAKCTNATTRPGGKSWSVSERCGALCGELSLSRTAELLPLISLAVRWRNALVHLERAQFKLLAADRTALEKNVSRFNKAAFDVVNALARFDQRKDPTLKDVTTFVAYVQELCKSVDSAAIRRVAGTQSGAEAVLRDRLRTHFKSRNALYEFWGVTRKHEWSASEQSERGPDRTDRGDFEAKWRTRFQNLLDAIGFSSTQRPASAEIVQAELGRIRGASARALADELNLPP